MCARRWNRRAWGHVVSLPNRSGRDSRTGARPVIRRASRGDVRAPGNGASLAPDNTHQDAGRSEYYALLTSRVLIR